MSEECQFPGCENDASATYCDDCRTAVGGQQPGILRKLSDIVGVAMWFLIFAMMRPWFRLAGAINQTIKRF